MSEEKKVDLRPSEGDKSAEIEKLKKRIDSLETELKDANTKIVMRETKIKRLEDDCRVLQADVKQANAEAMRWGKQVGDLTSQAILGQAMKEEGEKKLAVAKLNSKLADMRFLSSPNRQELSKQLKTLQKEDRENFEKPLQDISTLFLKAETDFQGYNKHYITYVEELTWWQRIWRNHGKSGINRAYRSYKEMTEQFKNIERQCNEQLAEMLQNGGQPNFTQLYESVKHQLIHAAEQQLVEMRQNYFDSSNLNPHSYATYLIHYISRLKGELLPEQSNIAVVKKESLLEEQSKIEIVKERLPEQNKVSYEPFFAKEVKIKSLYEQIKSEYEKKAIKF